MTRGRGTTNRGRGGIRNTAVTDVKSRIGTVRGTARGGLRYNIADLIHILVVNVVHCRGRGRGGMSNRGAGGRMGLTSVTRTRAHLQMAR